MRPFSRTGEFWPAGDYGKRRHGTLTFDPVNGLNLNLNGSFGVVKYFIEGKTPRIRLRGSVGNMEYTLDGCYQLAPNEHEYMPEDEQWHIDIVYEGLALSSTSTPCFHGIEFRIAHLEPWLGRRNIYLDVAPDPLKNVLLAEPNEKITLTWERPPASAADLPEGRLQIESRPLVSNEDPYNAWLSERTFIRYVPNAPADLEELLPLVGAVQQLLSLSVGRAAAITDIWVESAASAASEKSSQQVQRAAVFAPFRGAFLMHEDLTIGTDEMLFSAETTDGTHLVSRWLPVAYKYQIPIDLLLTSRYVPVADGRSRLAIASGAVEAFYNIKYEPRSDVTFVKRLKQLADSVGHKFPVLPRDVEWWAKRVKDDRTRVMHADPNKKLMKVVPEFQTHADDLEYLLMLCILREIDEDTLNFGLGRRRERRSGFSEQLDILTHRAPLSGRPPANLGR